MTSKPDPWGLRHASLAFRLPIASFCGRGGPAALAAAGVLAAVFAFSSAGAASEAPLLASPSPIPALPPDPAAVASARAASPARVLDELEFKELLTATLQQEAVKDAGELELRLARPWASLTVPEAPLTLKLLDLPSTGVSSYFIARFELHAGAQRLGTWQTACQAKIWREIPVAQSTLKRGQILADAPLALARRDVLSLREPLDAAAAADPSLELIEPVAAGQPVLARAVRVRPLVRRGAFVDGIVVDGPMAISLKIEALEDGAAGQNIRVRNPKTRREFIGKVQNEQTILIAL